MRKTISLPYGRIGLTDENGLAYTCHGERILRDGRHITIDEWRLELT